MIDTWRALLYPLGSIASLLFGMRCLIQWYRSEKEGHSVTVPLFWYLSIAANGCLIIHSTIQLQFWITLTQSLNAILAWRNIDLCKPKEKQVSRRTVLLLLISTAMSVVTLFLFEALLFNQGKIEWMRIPQSFGPNHPAVTASAALQLLGIIGICAYSLRFWIQWIQSEREQTSHLTKAFWWTSLVGASLSSLYFFQILDWVNAMGSAFALIPYIRNLMLMHHPQDTKTIYLFAGEISADVYGAALIPHLKKQFPEHTLTGVGGPAMAQLGFQSSIPFSRFQVMGFFDVFKRMLPLLYARRKVIKEILTCKPTIVLFIDSPALSLHIAKYLRKKSYTGTVVQYVAPTVWAWKKKRAETMGRYFDHLFCLFPFEPEYFTHTSLPCTFVGHPIVETVASQPVAIEKKEELLVGLFPGSRPEEIERNLPKQFQALATLAKSGLPLSIACALSPSANGWKIRKLIESMKEKYTLDVPVELVGFHHRYALMQRCSCALAKSGTVTLELALHKVPTVVTYELAPIDLFIVKRLGIDLPFYCIVNILAKKEVFIELIRPPVHTDTIAQHLLSIATDARIRSACQTACAELKNLITTASPSMLIAEALCEIKKR